MTLLSPLYLWGLIALVPLALIYFLKVRPRRKPTNAFFLWQKILEEKSASALFRRMRDVVSLLLMALVLLAIIFAMARPVVRNDDGRDLLLVIDESPSMAAGEEGARTLDLAKDEAKDIIRALDGTRRAAVAGLTDRLEFASHLSDSPKDLLDAVDRARAGTVPVSPRSVAELNRLAERDDARVVFLTDGNRGSEGLSEKVEVRRLKGAKGNAGIVAADLAWVPGRDGVASFFYRVASSFADERSAELILKHGGNGRIVRVIPLELKKGRGEAATLEIEGMTPGPWIAELEIADDLALDNRVTMGLNERRQIPVRVEAERPYFFQRSVEAFSLSGGLLVPASEGGSVVVSDGRDATGSRLLVFGPKDNSIWAGEVGEELPAPTPLVVAEGHPLLRHLDVETMPFAGARQLKAPDGSVILVESEDGVPLLYKARAGEREAVVLNLDPEAGDFVLSPWFPVIVYDAALHLSGEESGLRPVYATGSPVRYSPGDEGESLWTAPDGSIRRASEVDLRAPGIHRLRANGRELLTGVALLSESETMLDGGGPADSMKEVSKGRSPVWWLLVIALIVLVAESMLYHRRKLG